MKNLSLLLLMIMVSQSAHAMHRQLLRVLPRAGNTLFTKMVQRQYWVSYPPTDEELAKTREKKDIRTRCQSANDQSPADHLEIIDCLLNQSAALDKENKRLSDLIKSLGKVEKILEANITLAGAVKGSSEQEIKYSKEKNTALNFCCQSSLELRHERLRILYSNTYDAYHIVHEVLSEVKGELQD
jgi:hypothetical protein